MDTSSSSLGLQAFTKSVARAWFGWCSVRTQYTPGYVARRCRQDRGQRRDTAGPRKNRSLKRFLKLGRVFASDESSFHWMEFIVTEVN